ncbi:hypothetical protein TNCV_2789791 [Trichonephila clavipes]|nr:hypothetical protein TNCV_2789791 [Trichonephila clavipes]
MSQSPNLHESIRGELSLSDTKSKVGRFAGISGTGREKIFHSTPERRLIQGSSTNEILDRSNDMLDRSNDMLNRSNAMLDRFQSWVERIGPEKRGENCPLFSVLKIFAKKIFTVPEFEMENNPNPDSLKKHLAIQKHSEGAGFLYLMRSRETISIGWSFQRCLETPN